MIRVHARMCDDTLQGFKIPLHNLSHDEFFKELKEGLPHAKSIVYVVPKLTPEFKLMSA